MTRISTKLSAVLIATVTIGGAVISSTDQASAMYRGRGMGMGHMGHMHRGHCCHGGFGRGAMIGLGAGAAGFVAGAIIANAVAAQPRIYAESYDRRTGVRVLSEKVGNDRVVTTTDANGKKKQVVKKPNGRASASATDTTTGETTTSFDNGRGGHTITKTDAEGNPKAPPRNVPNKTPDSASSTDPTTGVTTKSVSNGNGTRTVTQTDATGAPMGPPQISN